jgi:hypothetical protein
MELGSIKSRKLANDSEFWRTCSADGCKRSQVQSWRPDFCSVDVFLRSTTAFGLRRSSTAALLPPCGNADLPSLTRTMEVSAAIVAAGLQSNDARHLANRHLRPHPNAGVMKTSLERGVFEGPGIVGSERICCAIFAGIGLFRR